ncbi:unnamed protein product [Clonostachys rosea]|uniref:Uncharacterized protein n=1 Tax=Bionectria ochroleuca TaxID=29856 RepID=A0ABY6UB07_BIOOC|nr:unnamed protein product [Clonostachys rosea]
MPSDQSQLDVVLATKAKRENDPKIASRVISEMKSSLAFEISWQDLLQAAPTSLSSVGACFAASTSTAAAMTLTPPPEQFTYLKHTIVKGNLLECADLGRYAFAEAVRGMGLIQQTGAVVDVKINDILTMIMDPPSAQRFLRPQLNTIQDGANNCLQAAQKIDKSNEICVAAEQTRLASDKSSVDIDNTRKTTELLGKQVAIAEDAFKTSSDNFPTGWDIMGQQIVGDLAQCVNTALSSSIPTFPDSLSPMKKLNATVDVVGSFVRKDAATNPHGPPPPIQPRPSPAPQNSNDPAYSEAIKLTTWLSALKAIVKSKDGGVDWDKAKGDGSTDGSRSSIKYLQAMFNKHMTQFSMVATSADPSQVLTTVLKTCVRISSEIASELGKSKSSTSKLPDKSSSTSTGRSLPGSSAGIPIVFDSEEEVAKVNAQTLQAQAVLDSAQRRLTVTQQILTDSKSNYVKSTEFLLQQQKRVADLQGSFKKLTSASIVMKEIKAILIACIQLIIHLKQNITDIVRFFNSLAAIIQVVVNTYVEPFRETLHSIVAHDESQKQHIKIANYSLVDLERTIVYGAVVTIRSYFDILRDIAKMWVNLSRDNIMPGLRLCDELATAIKGPNPRETLKKLISSLNDWSKTTTDGVATLAGNKQKEMLDGMQQRIDDVQTIIAQLDPPPPETKRAIAAGVAVSQEAATKYIEEKKKQSGLIRFANVSLNV